LADTAALLGLGERLRAVTLGHVADVDARQLHTADGSPSTSSWSQDEWEGHGAGWH
jgi:hypothetical protein